MFDFTIGQQAKMGWKLFRMYFQELGSDGLEGLPNQLAVRWRRCDPSKSPRAESQNGLVTRPLGDFELESHWDYSTPRDSRG